MFKMVSFKLFSGCNHIPEHTVKIEQVLYGFYHLDGLLNHEPLISMYFFIIKSDSDLYEVAVLGVCQVEPGLAGLVRQDVVEDAGGHLEVHTVQVTCLVGGQGQLRHQVLGHERVHLQITRVKLLHLRGERGQIGLERDRLDLHLFFKYVFFITIVSVTYICRKFALFYCRE